MLTARFSRALSVPRLALFPRSTVSLSIRAMSDLKTLPVLDASELGEGQLKAVEFAGGRVLLSKLKGTVHATAANCTHYGAPLEKGVLSADGRIVCPWHGACFNATTGDIEDAPGLDSLWCYKAEVKDGKIFVTANEKEVNAKVGRVIPRARRPAAQPRKDKVVIVGGGSGGLATIESLREHNFDGPITLISQEPYSPIDRTKLSKALIDDAAKIEWRTPEVMKNEFGVDLQLATTVSEVDVKGKTVTTTAGKVAYDHLVLSPGATPKRIPIPGHDLEGVITIRRPDDIKQILEALSKEADIIIIGTSFIGLEAAGALAKKELKSLTVVGVDEVPFEAMLGKDIGLALVKHFEGQGVKFHRGATVESISPSSSDPKRVGKLNVKGMDPLPATIVIMGTGVGPTTGFLKSSSLKLEKDGGVTVDSSLRVPDTDSVYAIGDIAHYPQFPDGFSRRVEHWNVAGNHGRHVGQAIATGKPVPYERVPIFWSSVGKGLRYVGSGAGFDDSYLDGSADELKAKGGKVNTVASMGRDPYVAKASELLREGKMPSLDEIRNGKNILEVQS